MIVNVVDSIMGAGKAQPLDSFLLSENGYIKMKEIHIGTKVYGEDGKLHNIIGIYPQGKKEVYRITFSDRTYTECCKEHLWTYQKPQDKSKNKYRTNTLEDIMNMELYKETKRGDKNWQLFIPMTKPLCFDQTNDLPIHPYILGVLLGDGHFGDSRSSITLTNTEQDIVLKVEKLLPQDIVLNKEKNKAEYRLIDTTYKPGSSNKFKQIFRDLKLDGLNSYNKYIPDIYKYSSIENRIELLKGLIDTDGNINRTLYEFSTTSKQLCNDVIFLVQSLGGIATYGEKETDYIYKEEKKKGHIAYRLYIKMPSNITLCSSKKHLNNLKHQNTEPNRSIRKIEYIGEKECQCILVDNPSHLYLTNDCIVTHNTSAAINYINNTPEDIKIIYITPYITEIDRIINRCKSKKFEQPRKYTDNTPKIVHLKDLLNKGKNIVTTHALFHHFDDEVIDLCYSQNYVLFMDEVTDVIEPYSIEKTDLEILLDKFAVVNKDTGLLEWRNGKDDYNGRFKEEKRLCEMGCLAMYGESVMLWMFPIKIFNAFRESYILTYMFGAQMQKYYYDYYGVEYRYLYTEGNNVDNYHFVEECMSYVSRYDYRKLINIIDDIKLNMIGDSASALSKTWYRRNENNVLLMQLKNNTLNFFNNKPIIYNEKTNKWEKSKSSNNIWTTFKDYKEKISGKGYAKGYIPSNMRASNEYRDRTAIAYLVNKYFNPFIKNFFVSKGIEVDEDGYALSEMLQFLWRSGIRDGKRITVYIPSKRMRTLLENWINEQEYKE